MSLLVTISALAFLLSLLNFLSIRTVLNKPTTISKKISILIPMRNEEQNARDCITALIAQKGLIEFEIIVLDDESTDGTSRVLSEFPKIQVRKGQALPQGWLGKNWACHQLSQAATGEILVFLDADVRVREHAIASAVYQMDDWDFISPYPRQLSIGFIESIFQPLLHWSWFASVPLIISQKFRVKSMVVANGQFLVINKASYLAADGHEEIKSEVLDDLELAKSLVANGFRGNVAEGSDVADCLMYRTPKELISGYQKSLWRAFGGLVGSIFVALLLLSTGVLSLILAIAGSTLAAVSFILILSSRALSSLKAKEPISKTFWHPVAVLIFVAILIYSWVGKYRGSLKWRDRVIS
jgi:glycosyltransferase involved in cell wall biosynthesis